MLNKTKIIAGVVAILTVSSVTYVATSSYISKQKHLAAAGEISGNTEVSNMASKVISETASEIDISPIDAAVSEGVRQIEDATASALDRIRQQTASKATEQSIDTSSSAPRAPYTIPLSLVLEEPFGKITFTRIWIDEAYKVVAVYFNLEFEDTRTAQEKAYDKELLPLDKTKCSLIDSTGKSLTKINSDIEKPSTINGEKIIRYYQAEYTGFDSVSDLSSITISFGFEDYEPVTATFNIPEP